MIDVVTTICARARDSYVAVSDDAPPTFVGSLTSFVRSMRLSELLSGGFYLPPPPSPSAPAKTADTPPAPVQAEEPTRLTAEEKGKGRAVQDADEDQAADERETPAAVVSQESAEKGSSKPTSEVSSSSAADDTREDAPSRPTGKLERGASSASSTASRPVLSRNNSGRPPRPEDKPYAALPPVMIVLLLPFYELLDANKTFCSLVYNDRTAGGELDRRIPRGSRAGC